MFKFRLLIAEDDPVAKRIFKNYMNSDEFELIFANNGIEAIEIIKSGEKVDLILMDIKMPQIDGFVAGGLIKKMAPEIPIIAQSAYTEDIVKSRIDRRVFSEFINKPIDKSELSSVLEKYLHIYDHA